MRWAEVIGSTGFDREQGWSSRQVHYATGPAPRPPLGGSRTRRIRHRHGAVAYVTSSDKMPRAMPRSNMLDAWQRSESTAGPKSQSIVCRYLETLGEPKDACTRKISAARSDLAAQSSGET